MLPNMRVRMRFSTIWVDFRRRFGSKIDEKSTLALGGLAKQKTLQNIRRGSKNQSSGSPKTKKNHRKHASDGDSEEIGQKIRKKTIFGALGARFGSPKRKFFGGFSHFCEDRFATPWKSPARRPKAPGLGALRLSPWSFKGLGLVDRPSSP